MLRVRVVAILVVGAVALGTASAPAAAQEAVGDQTAVQEPTGEQTTVVAKPPPVTAHVTPAAFSPNGDGRRDTATIVVRTARAATIALQVRTAGGRLVRRWAAARTDNGVLQVAWNGRAGGSRVDDGRYVVVATATNPEGASAQSRAPLRVDTRAPRLSIRHLVRVTDASRRLPLRYAVRDASSHLGLTLALHDTVRPLRAATVRRQRGVGTLRLRPRYRSGARLFPGDYRVLLTAADPAGNRTTVTRRLAVQRRMAGRVYERLEGTGRKVALTFDDCHFASSWASILDTLRAHRVTASFFCPGDMVRNFPDIARRTVREGHVAASHSWGHAYLTRQSYSGVTSRLLRDRAAWASVGGVSAPYFRPPYGAFNSTVVAAAGATSHPRVMMWDVDSRDTAGASGFGLICNVVCKAKPGSVILLHTKPVSASALPAIIRGLRNRGLEPVGLPELFRAAGHP